MAYRSWQRYRNERKLESRDDIKCVCPDGYNYLDTKYDFRMEGEDAIVEIEYFCLPVSYTIAERLFTTLIVLAATLQRHPVL